MNNFVVLSAQRGDSQSGDCNLKSLIFYTFSQLSTKSESINYSSLR